MVKDVTITLTTDELKVVRLALEQAIEDKEGFLYNEWTHPNLPYIIEVRRDAAESAQEKLNR